MKLSDNFQPQPSGKGAQCHTEKQANQRAYYDSITSAWGFSKPLSYSTIENLCKYFTGQPRGIPLTIWLEVINEMNELQDITNPIGFLRGMLTKRIPKP